MKIFNKIYNGVLEAAAILSAAAVLMCVSACSEDGYDDTVTTEKVRISFAPPVVDGISRAIVPDYEYTTQVPFHKDEKIMVFGTIYSKTTYNGKAKIPKGKDIPWATGSIYGEKEVGGKIEKPGEVASYDPSVNAWDTQEHKYWVKGKYYAFKAYSPSDLKDFATTVKQTNEYQPQDQPNKYGIEELYVKGYQTPPIGQQFDFMFSESVYEVQGPTPKADPNDPNANHFYNGVNLRFRHALSSIHFNVRLDPDYINDIAEANRAHEASHYSIKSIVLSGVYDKADFLERAGYKYEKQHNTYLFNPDNKPMWYNISEEAGAYKSKGASYDFISPAYPIINVPYELVSNDIAAKDIKELNDKAHIGFMIPQPITADAKVVVTWTYNDGKTEQEFSKEFYLNNSTKNPVMTTVWEMSKRYTYTITISNDFIDFQPSSGGWDSDNNLSF